MHEKRQALRRTPALSFHESSAGLDDVGGLGELKRWLRERRRAFTDEARRFGLPLPRGLLLLGVQGCGKSLSAKAVAREWNFPLLRLDLAAAFGTPDQTPEATIREATAVAESIAPCVLWIDEIEKGFAAANEGGVVEPRVRRVPDLALREAGAGVRGRDRERRGAPAARAAAPRPLRRPVLRRPADARGARRDPRDPPEGATAATRCSSTSRSSSEQAARLSGSELEQVVSAALYNAFTESRDLGWNDLANAITETVPLYETYEERIKELRDWARTRARPATLDAKAADLFKGR